MAKITNTTKNISTLKVNFDTNVRLVNNYDIPTMRAQIVEAGRIQKPIVVNGDTGEVLQGNRRTLAGQELYNDPTCPSDLKEALSKVNVIVYTGLTPKEEVALIMDHGGEKPISRTEVVQSVWRLDKQFYSETQICVWMLNALASYTGNLKKLNELPTETKAREAAIKTWLHGTVGNYILAASKMGEFVREQFLLTHKSEDKLLVEGEKVTMRTTRDRIKLLNSAKIEDNKDGNWDAEKGGPKMNALIEKYVKEDAGEPVEKERTMTMKDMREKADQFSSAAVKAAFLVASGKPEAGRNLADLDTMMYRFQCVSKIISEALPSITDPAIKHVLTTLIGDSTPAAAQTAMTEALKPFQK